MVSPSLFHDKSLGSYLSLLINIFPDHLVLHRRETDKKLHQLNYKKDELSRKLNVGQEHLSVEMAHKKSHFLHLQSIKEPALDSGCSDLKKISSSF